MNYPKKVLAGDVTPDFPIRMAHKDVSHALNLGAELGSPLLLGAHWLLRKETPRAEPIFRLVTGIQVALVFVIMVSAFERMRLYQQAEGKVFAFFTFPLVGAVPFALGLISCPNHHAVAGCAFLYFPDGFQIGGRQ